MFGSNLFSPVSTIASASKGLTFTKVLSGAGKALNFANKAIPMYYQIKPMLGNAKTLVNMYSAMKEPENKKEVKVTKTKSDHLDKKKESVNQIKNYVKNDTLTFFQ